MKKLILILVLLLTSWSANAGGPWLQKKNGGFGQLQTVFPVYSYSSLLMGVFIKETQGINRFVHNSDYSAYLEYGLTDRLNVITTLPFKYVKTSMLTDEQTFDNLLPEGDLFGMSNYHLALKYGLVDKKIKVAISLHSRWNTVSTDLDKGLATGYQGNSFGIMAHIGRGNEKHYGFLEAGYQKFTNGFSDVFEVNIEHGWKLGQNWTVAAVLNGRHALKNGSYDNENLRQTGLYPNDQSWAVISGKVAYERESGWGVNAALPLVPLRFSYVGFNGTVALGVYKKF